VTKLNLYQKEKKKTMFGKLCFFHGLSVKRLSITLEGGTFGGPLF